MTESTRLHELADAGQSPWLDNLRRGWITGGELAGWIDRGVRGLTSNPSIFQKAISSGNDYDEQFGDLIASGRSVGDAYWDMVTHDIEGALALLRPVYDATDGLDGFVSVEVAPELARDSAGTEAAARNLHVAIDEPNLYVKIPGTAEGLAPIRTMIAEGRSINITLIFSLDRYAEVMEAYLAGLEAAEGELSRISSVASFFISRVDTEVDRRLDEIGTDAALALRGKAAVAQAQVAYSRFKATFSGPRWDALVARGARVQRPLWASTSTKNPAYPDTLYVDQLIGPDSVNTMPDDTLLAFLDHGTVARTIDADPDDAERTLAAVAEVGVDLDDVARVLEEQGVAAFSKSFDELITALDTKAAELGAGA
ncbi:MAG TPA: transaldolase [Acidimicrobiales bacterium]